MSNDDKEKFEAINRLLEADHVLVHLNTGAASLQLPDHLSKEATVTLKLSRWFRGAMVLEPDRIIAELLFNERYHTCVIPFAAVWGVSSDKGENLLWPSSLPGEVSKVLAAAQVRPEAATNEPPPEEKQPRERPKLRRVK